MKCLRLTLSLICSLTGYATISHATPVNMAIASANGVGGGASFSRVVVDSASFGGACATIGATVSQSPAGACTGILGPIPPARIASLLDAQGNSADAEADKIPTLIFFKRGFVSAATTSVTKPTSASARFVDPLVFSDPLGESFDVNLDRFLDGLTISSTGVAGEEASGIYHMETSSNITGFLFSLDLSFVLDSPLNVDLIVGSYLNSLPTWNEVSLESSLRSLLDASNPDNSFGLSSFTFPTIPIAVPAGIDLVVETEDSASVRASVPEPSTFMLLAAGIAILLRGRRLADFGLHA